MDKKWKEKEKNDDPYHTDTTKSSSSEHLDDDNKIKTD